MRAATPTDAEAVGQLTEAVYREGGYTDDDYSRTLLDGLGRIRDAEVLVAVADGRVLGSVAVALPGTPLSSFAGPDEAEVRMLAVAPDARGLGIAGRLMDGAEALARRAGMAAVVLSTEPEMHAAHRVYQRRGYRRAPERDRLVGRFVLQACVLRLQP